MAAEVVSACYLTFCWLLKRHDLDTDGLNPAMSLESSIIWVGIMLRTRVCVFSEAVITWTHRVRETIQAICNVLPWGEKYKENTAGLFKYQCQHSSVLQVRGLTPWGSMCEHGNATKPCILFPDTCGTVLLSISIITHELCWSMDCFPYSVSLGDIVKLHWRHSQTLLQSTTSLAHCLYVT